MEEDGVRALNSKFWRCCPLRTPLSHFPRKNKGSCGLRCCLPPSCTKMTAFICFVSSLNLTRGSVYDETCLGNHLPWEGWGHPAQAASQLTGQLSGTAPALAVVPRPLSSQIQLPNEQEHCFPLLPRRLGGSLPHCTTPSPTRPGHPIFHLAPYQQPTLLWFLHPSCLHEFLHEAQLCFPSHCCLPKDRITELQLHQGLGFAWTAAVLLTHRNQALSCQQVPTKPF